MTDEKPINLSQYTMDDIRRAFIPAESPSHKRKAKAGRVRAQQEDRGKLVGKLPKERP